MVRRSRPTSPRLGTVIASPLTTNMATILLVERDRCSREGLRDSLARAGHAVETAADASQAMGKIKGRSFEVAIIDLDLPAVQGVSTSGWDLARVFQACNPASSIIGVSVLEDDEVRRQAAQLQFSQLLEKPISPTHLKAIIEDTRCAAGAARPGTQD